MFFLKKPSRPEREVLIAAFYRPLFEHLGSDIDHYTARGDGLRTCFLSQIIEALRTLKTHQ